MIHRNAEMNKSLGVSRRATKDTKAIKKKIVIFCTYFITKTISDLFSQQWFDFSYFPHFWEPDSIFQKLERFGRNLLMSLELLRVCPDFTPHSSPLFLSFMLNISCFWKVLQVSYNWSWRSEQKSFEVQDDSTTKEIILSVVLSHAS